MAVPGTNKSTDDRYHWWRWAVLVIFPVHLVATHFAMGLRFEHYLMDATFILLAWLGPRLRRLSWRCLPMGLAAIEYDYARFWAHLRGEVRVAEIYNLELAWFGVDAGARSITLPELMQQHTHWLLDLTTGLAYLAYLYQIVILGFYLYFRDEDRMSRLAWSFFLVNMMGEVIYLIYPAAPPWYVALYGLGPAVLSAPPSAGGCLRFDKLVGTSYFESFYSRNTNVFGAMPSLHVAYPLVAALVTARFGARWAAPMFAFAGFMGFAAVYLNHHWVWDLVFGYLFALAAYGLVSLPAWRARRRSRGGDAAGAAEEGRAS